MDNAPLASPPPFVVNDGAAPATSALRPPAESVGDSVLRTEGLTKQFGVRTPRAAVNGLALDVRRGDVFGLLGPNGSGKTTTLRMVLGLIWPTAGDIYLFGEHIADDTQRHAALQRIGAIVEQPAFYPYLSGRQNLQAVATFAGMPNNADTRARIERGLEQVGLASRARDSYKKYSLGMKQRLGIAAALLNDPELILLDEPTNGLDPAGMVEVRALISELARGGTTVLLSSHLLHEVQQVCTRVAILKDGALLQQGEVGQLLASQSGVLLGFDSYERTVAAAGVLHEASTGAVPWLRGVRYVQPEPGAWVPPGGWLVLADAPPEQAPAVNALLAAKDIFAAEVRRNEASLEQYFLEVTGGQAPQEAAYGGAHGAGPTAGPTALPAATAAAQPGGAQ